MSDHGVFTFAAVKFVAGSFEDAILLSSVVMVSSPALPFAIRAGVLTGDGGCRIVVVFALD